MKIERTKNAARNMLFGTITRTYQIIIPFLMRTAMTYFMGVRYLGLNSLFISILQVLNLAELGVGSAMIYSMYRPIAEDDQEKICALMRLYKKYYRVIGVVIAAAGLLLTPFIPKLISGDVPAGINVYTLYLLNLSATVLSYWLFAYKSSILYAHQRTDVISRVTLVTSSGQYMVQFLVLWLLRDYYIYILVMLGTQAVTNILTAAAAGRLYPDCVPRGELDRESVREINGRIRDLFTSKIGSVVVSSADTIVISAFLGLSALAVYQNYYFILSSVMSFVAIAFSACTAGIGNSIVVESREKNFNDLKKFTFLTAWIGGFCSACFLCLFQPFMKIWMGEELMLPYSVVVCFCIYFFVFEINQLLNTYKDAGGIWHEDRFRPLVTALANLGMNLAMVQFWGIYGIILSTVLSMLFVGMPWLLHNLFSLLFEKARLRGYLKSLLFYTVVSLLACSVTAFACSFIRLGAWGTFLARAAVCCAAPNAVFYGIYRRTGEFRAALQLMDKMTGGKFRLEQRLAGRSRKGGEAG